MVLGSTAPLSLQAFSRNLNSLPQSAQQLLREYIGATLHPLISTVTRISQLAAHLPSTTSPDSAKPIKDHLTNLIEMALSVEEDASLSRARLLEACGVSRNEGWGKQFLEGSAEELVDGGREGYPGQEVLRAVLNIYSEMATTGESINIKVNFKDRQQYEGGLFCGRKEGKGKLTYANGDVYVGNWSKGLRHGNGEYIWKSGARYSGQYFKNLREGYGTFKFPEDSMYEGEWKNGFRHGKGKMVWENQDVYEGDFVKSVRSGKGMFKR